MEVAPDDAETIVCFFPSGL